ERLKRRPEVVAADPAGPGFINLRLPTASGTSALPRSCAPGRAMAIRASARASGSMSNTFRPTRRGPCMSATAAGRWWATRSAYLRYREALGQSIGAIPEGLYPGDYLKETGRALAAPDGRKWLDAGAEVGLPAVRDFAIGEMMGLIRGDLAALGVRHDVFTSERAIVAAGAI